MKKKKKRKRIWIILIIAISFLYKDVKLYPSIPRRFPLNSGETTVSVSVSIIRENIVQL